MAKIALAIGIGVAGALTGGLAAAGFGIFGGTFAGGSVLGGVLLGGSLGLSAGRALGNLFFPQNSSISGPRMQDGQVSTSANGSPRPFGYGGFRLGAQIIWATPIKETKTTTTQSAKGAPSQTTSTFSYTISFAFAFVEVPLGSSASVTRIWGDSKLIYDTTSKGSVTSNKLATGIGNNTAIVTPVIYPGTATQQPDPTIQAHEGVNSTPAFRGTCYGVYTDFPLANFGNRLPNIRGEISSGTTNAYLRDLYPPTAITDPYAGAGPGPYPPAACYVDQVNRALYVFETPGMVVQRIDLNADSTVPLQPWAASTVEQIGNQIVDSNGNVQCVTSVSGDQKTGTVAPTWAVGIFSSTSDNHVTWVNVGTGPNAIVVTNQGVLRPRGGTFAGSRAVPSGAGVDTAGFLWRSIDSISPDSGAPDHYTAAAIKFDPRNFNELGRIFLPGGPWAFQFQKTRDGKNLVCMATPYNVTGGTTLYFFDANSLVNSATALYIRADLHATYAHGNVSIALDANSRAYVLTYGTSYKYLIARIDPRSGLGIPEYFEFTSNATVGTPGGILWDPADDSVLLFTDTGYIIKISCAAMNIVATSSGQVFGTGGYEQNISAFYPAGQVPSDGLLRLWTNQHGGVQELAILFASTLVQEQAVALTNWIPGISNGILAQSYDVQTNSLMVTLVGSTGAGFTHRLFLDRQGVPGQPLDVVVGDILQRGGMDAGDMDLTALSSIIVHGYLVARNPDVKGALAPLLQAFFFDLPEIDNKIKAVLRGGAVSTNIPESDLGVFGQDAKILPSQAQEGDLPKTLEVNYIDPAIDYQSGKQKRQRHGRVKKTKNKWILECPITMRADEAAQLAAKALQIVWDEKDGWEGKFWKAVYLAMDPSDVIQFTYNGSGYVARITKTTSGVDLTMESTMVSEDARNYNSTLKGATSDGFVSQTVNPLPPTLLFLLDLPLLQDIDAPPPGSTGYYYAMAAVGAGWPGAVLYMSVDNQKFGDAVGFASDEPAIGSVSAALPAPIAVQTWDTVNSLTVYLIEGALSSTTDLAVLNGANAALCGGEVLQFVNSVQNADGSFTVSRLLRGRRGTEYAVGTHQPGETFILLGAGGLHRNNMATAAIGIAAYFKAVSVGAVLTDATSQQLTPRGNDLKPYSAVVFKGATDPSSHDITLSWIRRTRIGGAWHDGTGTVPLAEESESYDLEIYDGATLVRTVSALTSPSYIYTVAQQNADFGNAKNTIKAIVYQNSAAVGRGFPAENDAVGISSGGGQPGIYQYTNVGIGGAFSGTVANPNNIIDGNPATYATLTCPSDVTIPSGDAVLASVVVSGMPIGPVAPTSVVLTVTYEVTQNNINGGQTPPAIAIAAGTTYSRSVLYQANANAGTTIKTTVNLPLPTNIDLRNQQVYVTLETDSVATTGSVVVRIYEAFITVT